MGDSGRHSPTRTVLVRPSSDQPEQEWTTEHLKVLYLISKYAAQSQAQEQRESWVRQTPLLVLIFEGIQAGALKFDYAPKVMHLYDKCNDPPLVCVDHEVAPAWSYTFRTLGVVKVLWRSCSGCGAGSRAVGAG